MRCRHAVERLEDRTLLSSISLGQQVFETIGTPGDLDEFSFTLNSSTALYVDALSTYDNVVFTLKGPGAEVSARYLKYEYLNPVPLLAAGDYTIAFRSVNDTTGAYAFQLLDLGAAPALTPGTPVTGTLAPASSTSIYTFSANAGDRYTFDADATLTDPKNAAWTLLDPLGRYVSSTGLVSDMDNVSLSMTGTYTLLVQGSLTDTGTATYDFTVNFVDNTPPESLTGTPLVLGATVTGEIAVGRIRDLSGICC